MTSHHRTAVARRQKDATRITEERVIPVILSTGDVDSDGEIIDQSTWRLGRFSANPIALYQHDVCCEPIGYYRRVRVEGGSLKAELVLYDDETSPEAKIVWSRYQQGGPVALSVGFSCPRAIDEDRGGQTVRVLYDCELEEASVVSIPSNPNAVAEARAKGAALYRRHRALAAHHPRNSKMNKFAQQLAKAGMTPEQFAAKAGMTPEEVAKLMDGSADQSAKEKAASTLQCSLDDLLDVAEGEDPVNELPLELGKAADVPALLKALGAKTIAEATVKAKALDALRGEHGDLARRVKSMETSLRADAEARDARERDEALEQYRRVGVLTPAREKGKVGQHIKGLKSAAEVKSYLDTLEPAADAAPPARQGAIESGASISDEDFAETSKATGIPVEKLKASAAQLKAAARP